MLEHQLPVNLEDGVGFGGDHSPFQAMDHFVVPPRIPADSSFEFLVLSFEFIAVAHTTTVGGWGKLKTKNS
jgi:hypothetical protein